MKKMTKLKYPMSAILNKEGMNLFGDIFPDKRIPILSPLSNNTELNGVGEKQIFLVNIKLLRSVDEDAYQKLIKKLSNKFNAPIEEMDKEFNQHGLPLRAELTSSVEIDVRFIS
jgi:hypothetical protein